MDLANLLGNTAARLPNKPGLILGDRRLSFSELDVQAQRLAFRLIDSGVHPGDRVALHMENGPELVPTRRVS